MPYRFVRALAACAIAAALAALAAPTAAAQKMPKRPKLAAGADSNDARVLYEYGSMILTREPQNAADAFYWATRVDPSFAEAYYSRRIALLMTQPRRLAAYWDGSRSVVQSDEIRRIDSLLAYAFMLNPVFPLRHERALIIALIKYNVEASGAPPMSFAQLQNLEADLDYYLKEWGAASRARMVAADGEYGEALALYATAIRKTNKKYVPELRAARGRLFLQTGKADSAVAELSQALEELHKRDKKEFIPVYNSKASLELTAGIAHERIGDTASARRAYGRALEEDLAYFPAHVRLGFMALDARDTTTAIAELELATQLRPTDGLLRQKYGFVLLTAGKTDQAIEQLAKAVEIEPWFALPHRQLGEAYEKAGKKTEAAAEYKTFLSLSSAKALDRSEVEVRLAGVSPEAAKQ